MADPYASHLPVLRAVCGLLKPRTVLELGSGNHSTTFFLSLPIDRLVTVETEEEWRGSLPVDKRLFVKDNRDGLSVSAFDLVFVDDGQEPEQRVETLDWALAADHPPVVVHDADVYTGCLPSNCSIIPTAPPTAVVW